MTHEELADSFKDHKRVLLDLTKVDGNAFSLMGAFKEAALSQGWVKADVSAVTSQCMTGSYNQLIVLLDTLCTRRKGRNA